MFCCFNIGQKQVRHPSALDKFEQIIEASMGKKIVMFLDYDGTLSPIVDDPDRAFMSEDVSTCFFLCLALPLYIIFFFSSVYHFLILTIAKLVSRFYVTQMRKTVKKLAKCFPTAIVTGRCRDKVHFMLYDSFVLVFTVGLLAFLSLLS